MTENASSIERVADKQPCVLSIVIPVHNEEEILERQALKLMDYVQNLTERFEVLFVENGSTDRTFQIIRRLQSRFSFIRLVKLDQADYSTAVIEGLKLAKGKYSIVFGIDYVDLSVLERCFHALKYSDIVICSKNIGVDGRPLLNRLANKYYNFLARMFLRLGYSDVEGYHGYNTQKVQALISDVRTRAHLCNVWILAKARKMCLTVSEVPLKVYEVRKSRFMKFIRLPYLAAVSLIELIKIKMKGY
ncbi:MAG: glycosyltransferase family 2 protein [Candidatus Bathyarchaeia archaeon]